MRRVPRIFRQLNASVESHGDFLSPKVHASHAINPPTVPPAATMQKTSKPLTLHPLQALALQLRSPRQAIPRATPAPFVQRLPPLTFRNILSCDEPQGLHTQSQCATCNFGCLRQMGCRSLGTPGIDGGGKAFDGSHREEHKLFPTAHAGDEFGVAVDDAPRRAV